uniref:F-box domain-containing protein n=1 Tax=Kalanchoe fedtschenkoi TaxID=63787 RepID=A0A7N0UG94_KALFE
MSQEEEEDDEKTMLPHDVIVEILSRLPVASLGRFKLVSKPWNSLISSRKFIEMHLKKSSCHGEDSCKFRVLMSAYPAWSLICERLDDAGEDDGKKMVQLPCSDSVFSPFKEMTAYDDSCDVIGACNGLVCFNLEAEKAPKQSAIVWNPSTGEHRHVSEDWVESVVEIDENRPPEFDHFSAYFETFGFGYDSSADDYKIVKLTLQDDQSGAARINILSIGTNKLVKIWDRICGHFSCQCGLFVHGVLHWNLYKKGKTSNDGRFYILSFSFEKEKLEEQAIPFPNKDGTNTLPNITKLFELGGKLSVMAVRTSSDSTHSSEVESDHLIDNYDIWVMQEYGVPSSWTKLISVDVSVSSNFFPLHISRNEGILAVGFCGEIVMHDTKQKTCRALNIPSISERKGSLDIYCELVYSECLVSPYTIPNPNWREEEI